MLQASQPHLGFLFSQQGPWGQRPHHLPALPVKKAGRRMLADWDPVSWRKEVILARGRKIWLTDQGEE